MSRCTFEFFVPTNAPAGNTVEYAISFSFYVASLDGISRFDSIRVGLACPSYQPRVAVTRGRFVGRGRQEARPRAGQTHPLLGKPDHIPKVIMHVPDLRSSPLTIDCRLWIE